MLIRTSIGFLAKNVKLSTDFGRVNTCRNFQTIVILSNGK